MDLEVQRERRTELLREAESRRAGRRRRSNYRASVASKLASLLTIVR
jgi:hypothetical protein